ncbi:Uu.00g085560.m01.CDS01 [Anthostomella pinea]|uniref:Uu.00g085560.m01.CDS01 n=1 Tax=Anthostomella pinea TaxID=933095 RepID=A0AAI8VLY9_9PEZI|nr:Uu.00g085560.m01.CDS01 [Anthostomella pinea]
MLSITTISLLFAGISLAAPATTTTTEVNGIYLNKCSSPRVRKSWQSLNTTEKKANIDAELCLQKLPADLGIRGAETKFDELQSVHASQTENIHWDEVTDAENILGSDLLDPVTGFGGNGNGTLGCVVDGPFTNHTVAIGPGYTIAPNCITRAVSDEGESGVAQHGSDPIVVAACMAPTNFVDFWHCVEAGPHSFGHGGVWGLMVDTVASPGDPIFYMHYGFLDKLWADWQENDTSTRYTEIGGNNVLNFSYPFPSGHIVDIEGLNITSELPRTLPAYDGTNLEAILAAIFGAARPADVPAPKTMGDPGSEVTLTHQLTSYGILPDLTIADIMDTKNSYLCYAYDS